MISSDAPPSAQKEKSSQSRTVGDMERTEVAIRVEDAVVALVAREEYVTRDVAAISGVIIPKDDGPDIEGLWKAP